MNRDEIRDAVLETIHAVAPESRGLLVAPDLSLREAIDLDSMDRLNVFAALEDRLRIDIPPVDQAGLATLDAIVGYALDKASAVTTAGRRKRSGTAALPSSEFIVHGTAVCIRPMRDDDDALQAEFVRHLSRTSRYQRFMVSMNELPPAKLDALTHVDQAHHVALVAETLHDGRRTLAGVVRYVVDKSDTACEFALAVDDAWQGSGLAGILMHTLMSVARSRGLRTMEGMVFRANDKMLKLCRQLVFTQEIDPTDHQTVRVVRDL